MTLALVRHGRTAWNLERRLQGRSDIALDAHGELQAHAAGRLLARAQWGRVVTSPLTRAAQTASIIGSYLGSLTDSSVASLTDSRAVSPNDSRVDPTSASGVAPTSDSGTAATPVSRILSPADAHRGGTVPFVEPSLLERDFGEAEGMQVAEAAERWPAGDYPDSETAAELSERAGAALTTLLMAPGTAIVVSHGVFLRAGIEAVTGAGCPRILNGQVVLLERTSGRPTARFLGE